MPWRRRRPSLPFWSERHRQFRQIAFSAVRYSAALNALSELVQTRRISHDASRHAISGLTSPIEIQNRLLSWLGELIRCAADHFCEIIKPVESPQKFRLIQDATKLFGCSVVA